MENKYQYQELLAKAKSTNATVEDRLNLLKWFETYDMEAWNGECFSIDESTSLYPILIGEGEPDNDGDYASYLTIDAEIR